MSASQWTEAIGSYSFQILLVIAVTSILDRTTRGSRNRSSLWAMTFWCVLALGIGAVTLPRLRLIRPWTSLHPDTLLLLAPSQIVLARVLLLLWSFGASVALARWLRCGYLLHGVLRRSQSLSASETQQLLCQRGSRRPQRRKPLRVRVLLSDEVDGPFCWQFHHPIIVLPRYMMDASADEQAYVMAHELEHLATHHPLQLFLQHAIQVVCWYHPVIWHAARRASLIREFACDDAAVTGASPSGYLRTLLGIAERIETRPAALGFGKNRGEISLRVERLVKLAHPQTDRGEPQLSRFAAYSMLLTSTILASQVCLPLDLMASSRATWSPWPTWSAAAIHELGIAVRDFEPSNHRTSLHELREDHAD